MEISEKNVYTNIDPYVEQVKPNSRPDPHAEKATHAAKPGDTVNLSREAKEVQEAQKAAKAVPDVRENKVAEIQQQIQAGTYKVNGDKVAFNMLRESLINQKI
ncbi:MAG: flagellar biosynthesis anti-sigma factor FlgM [Desulfobacterales bacterium]|nr:flagellar biosynthesis anti-sigma factor FlgM [Desulfobacterales bacterium]